MHSTAFNVGSETGQLKKVLIHSPDKGLGKVVPSKAQDWLFEDIVHLKTIRKDEYDYYVKLLLYFLDPEKIKGKLCEVDSPESQRNFYKPEHADFHSSSHVVELQCLLSDILSDVSIKKQLIASVCALEACSFKTQENLQDFSSSELAKIFLSGSLDDNTMIFAPIPNFIFTRDIGIVINQFILLNKPAKQARKREALLAKYIFFHHPMFASYRGNIIELDNLQHHFLMPDELVKNPVTLEGGDVMVVSPDHLLVGISERTSWEAAHQTIVKLFERGVVSKITVVRIPNKRDYMHIDTVFTQVKKDTWVMLGHFSNEYVNQSRQDRYAKALNNTAIQDNGTEIKQFSKADEGEAKLFHSLEDLLRDISVTDLGCEPSSVKIIFSGDKCFPYDVREQWTDSCNLLALKDGVVMGYDRNDKTERAFEKSGFRIIHVKELLEKLDSGELDANSITNTLILMPSAELSRARGGFHCMSMPLLRVEF